MTSHLSHLSPKEHRPTVLKNATLVLPETLEPGTDLLIADGKIAALDPEAVGEADIIDLKGQYLMPGIVDLHCDAVEKEITPRARTYFPLDLACLSADRKNALAGITTVFHCVSFADDELGVRSNAMAKEIVDTLNELKPCLTVDNYVHVRYEITDIPAVPMVEELISAGKVDMLSFMDHTPGQGQFHDVEKYATYMRLNYDTDPETVAKMIDGKIEKGAGAWQRIVKLADAGRAIGIPLVSHDDDTPEKVRAMADVKVGIAEFPVTIAAAREAKELGIMTMFGSPNLLRGESQAGNIRVIDALNEGVVDALCADYYPNAMLTSVFHYAATSDKDLAACVQMVTKVPAESAGLKDRGAIEVGRRADLIAVTTVGDRPIATKMWVGGHQALAIG